MAAKVLVSNIAGGTTEDEIEALFAGFGAIVEVELTTEGNADSMSAVVHMDIDKKTAQLMADRSRDLWFKERKLDIYVPLFM